MQRTQEEHEQIVHAQEEAHVRRLEENRQNKDQKLPTQPKSSAELLNSKKIQLQLAKMKEYAEAHKVQVKCQELES